MINTAADDLLCGVNRNSLRGECGQLSSIQRINWEPWNVKQERGHIHKKIKGHIAYVKPDLCSFTSLSVGCVGSTVTAKHHKSVLSFNLLFIQGSFAAGTQWSHSSSYTFTTGSCPHLEELFHWSISGLRAATDMTAALFNCIKHSRLTIMCYSCETCSTPPLIGGHCWLHS